MGERGGDGGGLDGNLSQRTSQDSTATVTTRKHSGGGGGASSQGSSLSANTALIPFTDIRLKKCIGEGSFGRVYMAVWSNHTEVAVKMLGSPASFAGKEDPLLKQRGALGGTRPVLAVGATAATAAEMATVTGAGMGETGAGTGAARGVETSARPDDGAAGDEIQERQEHGEKEDGEDEAAREGEDDAAAEVLDELEKEVAIMARLRHPNIVLLLGAVRSPPAIVEEFCARGSLFSVLQRHTKPGVPPLEWRVRMQMALGASAGMCYLHNCSPPIIHRDLKSPNLMVDRYFRVKVGDFNLSRVAVASVGSKGGGMSPVYSVGGLHSPRWMAPEVLQSAQYSRASDVYSFAVVLWELRALTVPWAQLGQWQIMHTVVEEEQRPPLDEEPTPSFSNQRVYDALICDGWAQDPADRPAFEEIITRLQGLIDAHARGTEAGAGAKPKWGSTTTGVITVAAAGGAAAGAAGGAPVAPSGVPLGGTTVDLTGDSAVGAGGGVLAEGTHDALQQQVGGSTHWGGRAPRTNSLQQQYDGAPPARTSTGVGGGASTSMAVDGGSSGGGDGGGGAEVDEGSTTAAAEEVMSRIICRKRSAKLAQVNTHTLNSTTFSSVPYILFHLPYYMYPHAPLAHTQYPIPYALYPIPYTLYPIPYTLYQIPHLLHPIPSTL
jgi:serine/threonine protein kinase